MRLGHEVIISDYDYKSGSSGRGRITIEIREMPDKDRFIPDRILTELTWTTHTHTDYLFGPFEMVIVASHAYDLNESAKVGRRIMKAIEDLLPACKITPFVALDALDKIKSTEMVHDWRLPELVPIGELLPQNFVAWYDTMPAVKYSTVQADEASARADILVQASLQEDIEWVKDFSNAGMPVGINTSRKAPDPTPARERLNNAFPQNTKEL